MPTLTNGVGISVPAGQHQYIINITTGTVTLSISPDEGTTYQTMTDGVFSASGDGIILTSDAHIKADITGTATVDLNYIRP